MARPRRHAVHLRRESTAAEYGDLLARGGFQLRRVVTTAGPHSIIEVVPV
ncbi:hypothetical protein ACIHDR_26570 [Nocardia sp. NPDC052278]